MKVVIICDEPFISSLNGPIVGYHIFGKGKENPASTIGLERVNLVHVKRFQLIRKK